MLFAVFDGHAGRDVSQYAKQNFVRILKAQESFQKQFFNKALTNTFMKLDQELREQGLGFD